MKSWFVRYGCEMYAEDCVVLCESEEEVKEWAIGQSHDCYDGYDHGEFEDEFEEEQWEEDNRFWLVEPYSPYDVVHLAAFDSGDIIKL